MSEVPSHITEEIPLDILESMSEVADLPVSEDSLKRLVKLAQEAAALEQEFIQLEIQAAEKEEAYKKMVRQTIPDLMRELGMKDMSLEDGSKIDVKNKVSGSISEANRPRAFDWMEAQGHGGIIKTSVVATFGKGEMEKAKLIQAKIIEAGEFAELSRSVHHQTLQSWVKERVEAGDKLPPEIHVFEFEEAALVFPKGTKRLKRPKKK